MIFLIKKVFLCYTMCIKREEVVIMKNSRRDFLKKVAYSAPVVVSLGMLVEPTEALSDGREKPKNEKSKIKTTRG